VSEARPMATSGYATKSNPGGIIHN